MIMYAEDLPTRTAEYASVLRRSGPVILILGWWAIDYGLWAGLGPIPYAHTRALDVSVLFGACWLATLIGFWAAAKRGKDAHLFTVTTTARRWPWIGLVLALLMVVPTIKLYSGYGLGQLGSALSNQSAAYAAGTARIQQGTNSRLWFVALQVLTQPLTMAAVPFFTSQWFQHRRYGRYLVLSLIAPLSISAFVARDVQAGLALTLVIAAWVVAQGRRNSRKLHPLRTIFLSVAAFAGVIGFGQRKISRNGGYLPCPPGARECAPHHAGVIETSLTGFTSYAAQGLEGLGHAFEGTWHFGGGLAHARAVTQLLHIGTTDTITGQLDANGWNSLGNWSTALTAFANDLPWVAIPFLMLLFGALLGISWRDTLSNEHWLPLVVFCYTFSILFLVPQNFVVGASGPIYVGYVGVVAYYLWQRGAQRLSKAQPRS